MKTVLLTMLLASTVLATPALAAAGRSAASDKLSPSVRRTIQSFAPDKSEADLTAHGLPGDRTLVEFSDRGLNYQVIVRKTGVIRQIQETRSFSPPARSVTNDKIGATASLHEDLIGFALAGDTGRIGEALEEMHAAISALNAVVSDGVYRKIGAGLKTIKQDADSGNMPGLALAAVENYRTLEEALDTGALQVPVDVSMLDYSGFKLSALAAARSPDWAKIKAAVAESSGFWSALEPMIADKGLRDLMTSVHNGLHGAVAEKDVSLLVFAARTELDSVDLLEHYFIEAYKTGTGARAMIDDPKPNQ